MLAVSVFIFSLYEHILAILVDKFRTYNYFKVVQVISLHSINTANFVKRIGRVDPMSIYAVPFEVISPNLNIIRFNTL